MYAQAPGCEASLPLYSMGLGISRKLYLCSDFTAFVYEVILQLLPICQQLPGQLQISQTILTKTTWTITNVANYRRQNACSICEHKDNNHGMYWTASAIL